MRNNCFVFPDFFSRNVGNSIKCEKNITPPPPHIWDTKSEQGNRGYNCPSLLFGETTSHLTSKWRGTSQYFFLMLEIAWNAKKTWNIEKNNLKILFFSIFKKIIKNSNNIPSISKTIQHTPMTWCTYLQSFEKIHQCYSYSAKTKRDGQTDGRTDGQTDGRTDGGIAISPVPGLRRRGR